MNPTIQHGAPIAKQEHDEIDLATYFNFLVEHRWLIAYVALAVTILGAAYAFLAKPVYQANILFQVEETPANPNGPRNILGEAAAMFDVRTDAASEMEILRSRMVVSQAVDNLHLNITSHPKYFPLIGEWIAKRSKAADEKQLSDPGLLGFGGYVWGAEQINVPTFVVPRLLQNQDFVLTVGQNGQYRLTESTYDLDLTGRVGAKLIAKADGGNVELLVNRLNARPGAQFILSSASRIETIENLQKAMDIGERGRQSGIIGVALEGADPQLTTNILNEIANEYLTQNEERKSAEATKSLEFLDRQLPNLKRQLEDSEAKFNQFRNANGTVDLGEEARTLLNQSTLVQTRLTDLKQRREELLVRFAPGYPTVIGVESQMSELNREMASITAQIKRLPLLEQEQLRLARDVRVNTDLYTALLNTEQQLLLVKAGKVGNVRLVDAATLPEKPVRPIRALVIGLALLIGLFLGIICAYVKKALFGGVSSAHEIEQALGLPVYATIPHSEQQESLYKQIHAGSPLVSMLAQINPNDMAIESLRNLRSSLPFLLSSTQDNSILITAPSPGMGKSFVSINFAVVLASAGKKVLVIDADLRKGHLHNYFGLGRENGLVELIAGTSTLEQVLHKKVAENIDFISTGNLLPNTSELLLRENIGTLLKSFSSNYDYVLIDTAPVLAVSDALILGPLVGAMFMVTRAGKGTIGEIKESVKRCNHAGFQVKGVILNDVKSSLGGFGHNKYEQFHYSQQ